MRPITGGPQAIDANPRQRSVALRLRSWGALALCAATVCSACHPGGGNHGAERGWTTYTPGSPGHAQDFIKLVSELTFIGPDLPQTINPVNTTGDSVYVDLLPEQFVAPSFDPANCLKGCGDPHFATDRGRVLAKIVNRDRAKDFDRLQLSAAARGHEFVIWWVETGGDPAWQHWKNHYYKVDLQANTVVDVDAQNSAYSPTFVFHPENWSGATPRLADWNKQHVWPDSLNPPPVLFIMDRQSTWASCGSGCCNGR